MPKVIHTGDKEYGGYDGAETLRVFPGETVEVSEAKAAQLLADFPHVFAPANPIPPSPPPHGRTAKNLRSK